MAQLFDKIGWFDQVLALVAWLVALVAAASVLASIYNSMSARRRDIAILRALGARRGMVFASIVLEASAVAAMGSAAGFVVHVGLLAGAGAIVRAQTGVLIEPFQPGWVWLWAPAAPWLWVVVAAAMVGTPSAARTSLPSGRAAVAIHASKPAPLATMRSASARLETSAPGGCQWGGSSPAGRISETIAPLGASLRASQSAG